MVRPVLVLVAVIVAGCTAPAYTCGHPVPCARGSVQSCTSRDGKSCRYLLSDGTPIECAACDDCFAAEREIAAWCDPGSTVNSGGGGAGSGGGGGSGSGGNGSSPGDLATAEPRDMSYEPPPDLSRINDLARDPRDFSTLPPDDMAGYFDTDLGCYAFGYACNNDPACCATCCAGGCTVFGYCALDSSPPDDMAKPPPPDLARPACGIQSDPCTTNAECCNNVCFPGGTGSLCLL
jgi:hypothetical protein